MGTDAVRALAVGALIALGISANTITFCPPSINTGQSDHALVIACTPVITGLKAG